MYEYCFRFQLKDGTEIHGKTSQMSTSIVQSLLNVRRSAIRDPNRQIHNLTAVQHSQFGALPEEGAGCRQSIPLPPLRRQPVVQITGNA